MGPGTSYMQLESMCHDSCSIKLKRAEKNVCVYNGQNCTVKNGVLRYTFAMVFWDTFIYVGVT